MSNTSENSLSSNTCANCGKEGSNVTNTCNKCKMIIYCSAACKKKHRHKHKKDCEEHLKRVADLHDEELFKQPPPKEDCPICFLRLPSLVTGTSYMACCGKSICRGCMHAFQSRATRKKDRKCPFCRTPPPKSGGEELKRMKKRVELNDVNAIHNMGYYYYEGIYGLRPNLTKALELYHRAGELGNAASYYNVAQLYRQGRGGVEADIKKAEHYYELAAMMGDADARHCLGVIEWMMALNMERAIKHFMIAANGGCNLSLRDIRAMYKDGDASKENYAKALRLYQAYVDDIKSSQRDEAAAAREEYKYYDSAL